MVEAKGDRWQGVRDREKDWIRTGFLKGINSDHFPSSSTSRIDLHIHFSFNMFGLLIFLLLFVLFLFLFGQNQRILFNGTNSEVVFSVCLSLELSYLCIVISGYDSPNIDLTEVVAVLRMWRW